MFVIPVAARSDGQSDVAGARNATASFHDLDTAKAAGYTVQVADVNGITCIDNPGTGAMGVHYLDPGLVPELFEERPRVGRRRDAGAAGLCARHERPQRLVALEYLTIKGPWDAQHAAPPSLFGQPFNETPAPTGTACRPSTASMPGSGPRTRPTCSPRGTHG